MKKLLLVITLLIATAMQAQLARYNDIALYNYLHYAKIAAGATITVCTAGDTAIPCASKVNIFSDIGGTHGIPNPTFADDNGNYGFYVAAGIYTITVTGPGIVGYSMTVTIGSSGATAAHNLLSATHTDTNPATPPNRGSLVTGQGASPTTKWTELLVGPNPSVFCSNGVDAYWGTCWLANTFFEQMTPPRTDLSYAILYPTAVTQYGGPTSFGYTRANNLAGDLQRFHSAPLGDWDVWIQWANFTLPSYVAAANVQYVYAVVIQGGDGINGVGACNVAMTFNAGIFCSGTGANTGVIGSQVNLLLASGAGAATWDFANSHIAVDSAETISQTINYHSNIPFVALVVFYSGTQVPQQTGIAVVPPLYYNPFLNTLSYGSYAQMPPTGGTDLLTAPIGSGACSAAQTTATSGVTALDAIVWSFASDPSAVTGYGPSASGSLYVVGWPTTGNVNFKVCNPTAGSITPGAMTINWKVEPR